jgi:general secretion pathway protein G
MNNVSITNRNRSRRAFTLIELLLVLVILAVLAAVVVPKFTGRSEQAKQAAAKTDISMLDGALELFENDNGRYPTSDEGLRALTQQPGSATNWHGPYIKKGVPNDPWGQPYQYRFPGQHNANGFDLYSFGQDGREGNDDVTNWDEGQ